MRTIDGDVLKRRAQKAATEAWKMKIEAKVETILNQFIDWINEAPTIQPEPHWIPVTQDIPTEDDDYWATFDAETGRFVDWCSWYHGRWVVWLDDIPNEVSNVIAWCKPMEPYKGVTE